MRLVVWLTWEFDPVVAVGQMRTCFATLALFVEWVAAAVLRLLAEEGVWAQVEVNLSQFSAAGELRQSSVVHHQHPIAPLESRLFPSARL